MNGIRNEKVGERILDQDSIDRDVSGVHTVVVKRMFNNERKRPQDFMAHRE